MKRISLVIGPAVLLLWCDLFSPRPCAGALEEAKVELKTAVGKDSIRVGERLRVRYELAYAESLTLVTPVELPKGKYNLLSMRWREKSGKDGKMAKGNIVVITLDLKEAFIPSARLLFTSSSGETLASYTDEVHVPVRLTASGNAQLKPIKKQWEAPKGFFLLIILGLLAALIMLAVILWKRRRPVEEAEPERPLLPPDFIALRELGRIEKSGLLEKGELREYYTRVIDVLRAYIEGRFGIDAMEKTSGEILEALSFKRIYIDSLEEIMWEADLVKFAKFKPMIESGRRVMQKVRQIVIDTAPTEEPQAASEKVG